MSQNETQERTPTLSPEEAREGIAAIRAAMDRVVSAIEAGNAGVIRTIPAGTPMAPPEIVPDEPPAAEGAKADAFVEPAASVRVSAEPVKAPLTDEEIYNKVGLFLDPTSPAPLYISNPIRGRVYVGLYPNYSEMLRAQALVEGYTSNIGGDIGQLIAAVGEILVSIKGWLYVHEPALVKLKQVGYDFKKWPPLRSFDVLNSRDPQMQEILLDIWRDYNAWKASVVPTGAELEKYYARRG